MYLCDKCRHYDKCAGEGNNYTEEFKKLVSEKGCRMYEELPIERMFGFREFIEKRFSEVK